MNLIFFTRWISPLNVITFVRVLWLELLTCEETCLRQIYYPLITFRDSSWIDKSWFTTLQLSAIIPILDGKANNNEEQAVNSVVRFVSRSSANYKNCGWLILYGKKNNCEHMYNWWAELTTWWHYQVTVLNSLVVFIRQTSFLPLLEKLLWWWWWYGSFQFIYESINSYCTAQVIISWVRRIWTSE